MRLRYRFERVAEAALHHYHDDLDVEPEVESPILNACEVCGRETLGVWCHRCLSEQDDFERRAWA